MEKILKEIPRERGEVLRLSVNEYKGKLLLNIRIWYTDENEELRPTKKGVTVNAKQFPDFKGAVIDAEEILLQEDTQQINSKDSENSEQSQI
jgi:hypothetical protein